MPVVHANAAEILLDRGSAGRRPLGRRADRRLPPMESVRNSGGYVAYRIMLRTVRIVLPGKKEGSCGPDWSYVTSCSEFGMPEVGLMSARSVVRI